MEIKFEIKKCTHAHETAEVRENTSFDGGWLYIRYTPEELVKTLEEGSSRLEGLYKFLEAIGLRDIILKKLARVN